MLWWAQLGHVVGRGALDSTLTAAPANTILPMISGTTTVGSTLSTTNGTWTGTPTITYAYQWKRDGSNISGATASSYLLVTADIAATITVTVTATNSVGSANATASGVVIASAESAAFLARTSGLDTTHTNAYTALINGLVTDAVWSKLDVLQIYATQDSTTALLNLKSTSYNGVSHGSPTFTADRGFTGVDSSTTVYIDTGFNPATASSPQYALNSAHVSIWQLNNITSTSLSTGASDGTYQTAILTRYPSTNVSVMSVNQTNAASLNSFVGSNEARGHWIAGRTSSSAAILYRNAVNLGSSLTSFVIPSRTLYALAYNNNNAVLGCSAQIAMLSIGGGLSSTDVTNFYNRLRSYMTAVGVP